MDNYQFITAWVAREIPGRDQVKVLDYGCGQGRVVDELRKSGIDAYGCDVFFMTDTKPADYVLRKEMFGTTVFGMPDGKIPFPDATFDIVINNQVLEHVEAIDQTIREMDRVLKPGGKMLCMFPDRSVWREGHVGIAFIHWFPKRSKLQFAYAYLCRSVGFGYHKNKFKTIADWTRNRCNYLAEQTFYLSMPVMRRKLSTYCENFRHIEAEYALARFGKRAPFLRYLPKGVLRLAIRKAGGVVVTCQKRVA